MGEFNATDGSWKKMVIAKSDNEWTSTIKSERPDVHDTGNSAHFSHGFSLEEPGLFESIKRESEVNSQDYQHVDVTPVNIVQEVDPLLVEAPNQRRPKGSGLHAETPEERAVRLAKMSAYAAQRLANETAEQRALRLKRMSQYAAKRLSQETSEQRAKRLARMSAYAASRLAKETPEQRRVRLSRMSAYAAKRQAMKKSANCGTSQSSDTVTNYDPLPLE